MYSLLLLNKVEIYATEKLAAQNAAHFLRKFVIDNHWLWSAGITANYRTSFESYFQREDYAGCVKVWNMYAEDTHYPRPEYVARIQEKTIDKLFT
jgi:hypothetical protein